MIKDQTEDCGIEAESYPSSDKDKLYAAFGMWTEPDDIEDDRLEKGREQWLNTWQKE